MPDYTKLKTALDEATADGTLDHLAIFVSPDVINTFCDAVAAATDDGIDPQEIERMVAIGYSRRAAVYELRTRLPKR